MRTWYFNKMIIFKFYLLFVIASFIILQSFNVNAIEDDFSEFDGEDSHVELPKPEKISREDHDVQTDTLNYQNLNQHAEKSSQIDDEMPFPEEEFELVTETSKVAQNDQLSTLSSVSDEDARPLFKDLKIATVPDRFTRSWNSFHLELIIMIGLMIYMFNFLSGKNKNARLASAWFLSHKDLLSENFAIVGDDGVNQPPTNTLLKEYEHIFSLWCTGRTSVEGMLVEIKFLNRQCLLSSLMQLLKPVYDTLTVHVYLEDSEMDPWVMAIAKKRKVPQLLKDYTDLSNYVIDKRGVKHPSLPDSFLVLNEVTDATSAVLSPTVCKLLTKHENNIEYLHFSDQYSGIKNLYEDPNSRQPQLKKVLTFCFKIGDRGKIEVDQMEELKLLMQFVIYMIDKIPRIRLNKMAKAKTEASRKAVKEILNKSQHQVRQEAAQLRKDEKRRAVKERIMAEEDPDRARRLEEKEQKREKKKSAKMKMIKVKNM